MRKTTIRVNTFLSALLLALSANVTTQTANAQSVIFPQIVQAGEANYTGDGTTELTLSNELLTATFLNEDGKLLFGGCPEMGLKAGTELFTVALGNEGNKVPAPAMTVTSWGHELLTADPTATVASERLPGHSIRATLEYGDLRFEWRAILRDGSHYLRTELTLTAVNDVEMHNVIPMIYEINAADAPEVIGNTRGAVLASESIFAGLETPTGINSIETADNGTTGAVTADEGFMLNSWSRDTNDDYATTVSNPLYFTWQPGSELPAGIKSLGFTASDVHGKRGFGKFSQSGTHTVTFRYTSGTHRLNILGVDLLDSDGNVVASDYHTGYTGGAASNNVYTLNVPAAGTYLVRYFMDTKTEGITSSGTITWSPSVISTSSSGSTTSGMTADEGFTYSAWSPDTTNDYYEGIVANPSYWTWAPTGTTLPTGITNLGFSSSYVRGKRGFIKATTGGNHTVTFRYGSGSHGLNILGVDLLDKDENVVASDYHIGFTGGVSNDNVYNIDIPEAGTYYVRYFIEVRTETVTSSGTITWNPSVSQASGFEQNTTGGDGEDETRIIQGLWSRHTTLEAGKSWKVSSVVGLIAPDQARRSFLAYSERERAVAWRPFPHYNSWYELNIDRNNSATYEGHMTAEDCVGVVNEWKTNLFDKHGVGIKAFVWDDGWDEYGTWSFNKGFPNGFKEPYEVANQIGAGTGAWLGPVGGYGTSGDLRRAYWSDKGGMQLSNPAYYNVFLNACSDMVDKYNFCFFKLDGISAQFSSTGPDSGYTGEENAEGIIDILSAVREIRPDMFFNTTVGTWASPFWFHYTDAVWRQEQDYGEIGNQGTDREKWITYRDRLVYQNFIQNSPLCPINTLMTHGVILTEYGDVSKNMDYAGIVREIRCAFACGSGMVELYCDSKLLNSINNGALWKDIANCIKWQEKNAEVLPDIHWVGGNPWDGSSANVYGWAAWNGNDAVLTLRNPSTSAKTFTFTLRDVLEIPDYETRALYLEKAFEDQADLSGLSTDNKALNLDTPISVSIPGSSVYVFDGSHDTPLGGIESITPDTTQDDSEKRVYDLNGRQRNPENLTPGIYIVGKDKVYIK